MGSFRSHWEVKEFFDISGHRAGLSIFKQGEVVHHVTGGSAGLDHFPLNGTSGGFHLSRREGKWVWFVD